MLYDRKYCTFYMIENTAHITAYFQRTERMIREKDKPCEKTQYIYNCVYIFIFIYFLFIYVYVNILILDLNCIPYSHQLKPTKTHPKRQCLQIPCLSPEVMVQMASVNRCPLKLIKKRKNQILMGSVSVETILTQPFKQSLINGSRK